MRNIYLRPALAATLDSQVLAAVRRPEQVDVLQTQGVEAIALGKPEALGAQVNAVFNGGADVIFDTCGFWLPAAVAGLAPFGRIAIIAAPVDGHVQLPALALYRKGGSVVGGQFVALQLRAVRGDAEAVQALF